MPRYRCSDCEGWLPAVTVPGEPTVKAHCTIRDIDRKATDPCCPQCRLRNDATKKRQAKKPDPTRVLRHHGTKMDAIDHGAGGAV